MLRASSAAAAFRDAHASAPSTPEATVSSSFAAALSRALPAYCHFFSLTGSCRLDVSLIMPQLAVWLRFMYLCIMLEPSLHEVMVCVIHRLESTVKTFMHRTRWFTPSMSLSIHSRQQFRWNIVNSDSASGFAVMSVAKQTLDRGIFPVGVENGPVGYQLCKRRF